MTVEQRSVVVATWQSVSADRQTFAREFYQKLFNKLPSLRHLFAENMSAQERKLATALDTIVKNLASGRDIAADLRALGKRHATYGVESKDYAVVGEVLISTLQQFLGAAFTTEAKGAWTAAYLLIADTMKRGAKEP